MRISVRGVAIEVDDRGPASAEPLLMVMGLGMQLIGWPEELVGELLARGFRVIRFDNRDIGLSQGFDEHGVPNVGAAAIRFALRLPVRSPYTLRDMADDAVGVLDALGIERAHVCGASMGGMISQHIAVHHPRRLKSLTLMMTTSGSRRLPQAPWRVQRVLMSRPPKGDLEGAVEHLKNVIRVIGSPAYPPDPAWLTERLQTSVRRAYRPAGVARQMMAIAADGDRTPMLGQISAPTLVIHGAADPLVPVAAGHDLARRIAGARSDIIEGMGHDLPVKLHARFAEGIAALAEGAARDA